MNLKFYILPVLSLLFLSGCQPATENNLNISGANLTGSPSGSLQTTPASDTNQTDTVVAINTKYGQIVIKLYPDKSPDTVANFLKKVNSDFYRNLTFHRVEPGFVIQGGDPLGNGTGGGTITSEINNQPFKIGSVGMARGNSPEISNDSQFFICLTTSGCQHLTNQYVNFGEVISGQEIANQIRVGDIIIDITNKTK